MLLHPDSVVYADHSIKRAGELKPGDRLVGLDAHHSVAVVDAQRDYEDHPLITLRSKHRELTTVPQTKLLMLRRNPVDVYPPTSGWWTEPHPISDLLEKCRAEEPCTITDCWCLKHKRHFVTLNRLARHDFPKSCGVGPRGRAVANSFDSHEDATQARFHHIAHGHVVSPVDTVHGPRVHVAATNTRARQIIDWGIVPALPGPEFSVERVMTVSETQGPLVWIDVSEPVIIEATVVMP